LKNHVFHIAVLICGAMITIFELTAACILAPYCGTSNMVWTSIIGIILLSISIGYLLFGSALGVLLMLDWRRWCQVADIW